MGLNANLISTIAESPTLIRELVLLVCRQLTGRDGRHSGRPAESSWRKKCSDTAETLQHSPGPQHLLPGIAPPSYFKMLGGTGLRGPGAAAGLARQRLTASSYHSRSVCLPSILCVRTPMLTSMDRSPLLPAVSRESPQAWERAMES